MQDKKSMINLFFNRIIKTLTLNQTFINLTTCKNEQIKIHRRPDMAELFEQTEINGMNLKNRIVRSATWEGMCDNHGKPYEKLNNLYLDLARGGTGLIITGFAFVRPDGRQLLGKMGIHTDEFAEEFKKLTDKVHETDSKIVLQLAHAGGQTSTQMIGRQPLAPSAVKADQYQEIPVELTKEDIKDIVTDFGEAARRAKNWGFDGVQFHSAHGYLINQFLSPHTNYRTDEYGGSIENRSRFLMEIYHKVRETIGQDFPVLIKLNASDNLEEGLKLKDAIIVARQLSHDGIDAMEISSGTSVSGDKSPSRKKINNQEKEAYNLDLALRIKKEVCCPVIAVGGFRSFEIIERTVRDYNIDYVALSRSLIREPDLPNRWLQGDRSPAKCISCNRCFVPGFKRGGIYCVHEKKISEK
jgi:2,4-dienoyl-CoA reductase-like NADH-dependent reductase (Old Yellow Enzyme family)